MVVGTNLFTFYQENFLLVRHGFSLEAVENMIPYEKQIYLGMLKKMKGDSNG